MDKTITEFIISNSEAIGAVVIVVSFMSILANISPMIQHVFKSLMGGG